MVDKFEAKRFPKQPSCDMCSNQAAWRLTVDDSLPLNLCETHERAVREYFKGKQSE